MALDVIRRDSFEGIAPTTPAREESERIVGLVRQLSEAYQPEPVAVNPPLAPAPASLPPSPAAPPPVLAPALSIKSAAVVEAQALLEAFEWAKVRDLLLPFAAASDARARVGLAEACLHLCEEALSGKDAATAKERAQESLAHATAAVELDPASAPARVWFGQAVQTKAKVLDGVVEVALKLPVPVFRIQNFDTVLLSGLYIRQSGGVGLMLERNDKVLVEHSTSEHHYDSGMLVIGAHQLRLLNVDTLRNGKDGLVAREDHVRGQLAAHVPQPLGICVRHAPLDLELGPKKLCAPRAARAAREFRRPAIRKRGVQQPL